MGWGLRVVVARGRDLDVGSTQGIRKADVLSGALDRGWGGGASGGGDEGKGEAVGDAMWRGEEWG